MDVSWERAFAASDLSRIIADVYRLSGRLFDKGLRQDAAKLDELAIELLQLHRELVELPRESGVPAPLEDGADASEEGVPF